MPTPTPSAAALDLALHTHLRQGLVIETLGDLLDLAQAADLPRDLPMETITAGCLLARYCPAIEAMPGHPGSGYHAHLDLTGIDDADPDDADRPTVAEILSAAQQCAPPAPPPVTRLYLDIVGRCRQQQRYLAATDGRDWNVLQPTTGDDADARRLANAVVAAWLDYHPGQRLHIITDHALTWDALAWGDGVTHSRLALWEFWPAIEQRLDALLRALPEPAA